MSNELRVRANFLGGLVEDNPLASGATTLTSAGLASLPAIGSTQHLAIILDPDGVAGVPEIVYVTAHAAAATTATITRGAEGTTARAHDRDTPWAHGPTVKDFDAAGGGTGLIGLTSYEPADTTLAVTSTAADGVDLDATNMAVSFTVPPSGTVLVRLTAASANSGNTSGYWNVREGSVKVKEALVMYGGGTIVGMGRALRVSGLTPGAAKTYKWGARVNGGTLTMYLGVGYGPAVMEVWAVNL